MNILMIGNGFDLAHGLPTKYTDFLKFCRMIKAVYNSKTKGKVQRVWEKLDLRLSQSNEEFYYLFCRLYKKRYFPKRSWHYGKRRFNKVSKIRRKRTYKTEPEYDNFYGYISDNIWIEYFWENPLYQTENWIDFENEISKVIRGIDEDMQGSDFTGTIRKLSNKYFRRRIKYWKRRRINKKRGKLTYEELRDLLLEDLRRLVKAFEIYLKEFVEQMSCNRVSSDINKILFDKVLSFNYTDTYDKKYGDPEDNRGHRLYVDYEYIHGKVGRGDLVLGIDEYLPADRKDRDIEFIAFKKYFQRINGGTGRKYKEWLKEINSGEKDNIWGRYWMMNNDGEKEFYIGRTYFHCLYIFGHSLDITDRDVLRDFLLNDRIKTKIFYLNDEVKKQQIANLVKIIGQEELVKRSSGELQTIEFIEQKSMKIEYKNKINHA